MGKVREPRIQYDGTSLVDAHWIHTPKRIIIHDTEGLDAPGIRDLQGLAEFFNAQGRGYGYHVAVDAQGNSARLVPDNQMAWHVAGQNTDSLGISMIAQARFTSQQWWARPRQLHKVARWLAWWATRYSIPLTLLTELGGTGVGTHAICSSLDGAGGSDHTDPGGNFPLRFVIYQARLYQKRGW